MKGHPKRWLVGCLAVLVTLVLAAAALRIGNPLRAWRAYSCANQFMSHLQKGELEIAIRSFEPRASARFLRSGDNAQIRKTLSSEWPTFRAYWFRGIRTHADFTVLTFKIAAETVEQMDVTVRCDEEVCFVTLTDPPGI